MLIFGDLGNLQETFTTEWKNLFSWAGSEQQKTRRVGIILVAGVIVMIALLLRGK